MSQLMDLRDSSSTMDCATPPRRQQKVYLVRHAEALHNIHERQALQAAAERGIPENSELAQEMRRSVLNNESFLDAPLSSHGISQVRAARRRLRLLDKTKYPAPQVVLVSPLRRALMTATELFAGTGAQFVALEVLREKRTGYAADERRTVPELAAEFPHVDFSYMSATTRVIEKGETNRQVQARGREFLEEYLPWIQESSVAIVTHKGWLRELRKTVKERVDEGQTEVDFDVDQWHQTLFGNAEIRLADFGWKGSKLTRIVSRSVETALKASTPPPCSLPIPKVHSKLETRGHGHNMSLLKQIQVYRTTS